MPFSDIDFNLVTGEGRLDDILDRPRATESLKELKTSLGWRKEISNLILVRRAKIPIIRGVHNPTGLDFQIQQTTNAYNSTQYIKNFLKQYPILRDLFYVLRQMLIMRGLSDGSKQGLSSYPLFNMIVTSLKLDEQRSRLGDIGTQLLSFLKLYSEIDFNEHGLALRPARFLPKVSLDKEGIQAHRTVTEDTEWAPRNAGFGYAMYLRDPADPSNDLGRNCAMIRHVQATFLVAKGRIRTCHEVLAVRRRF